MSLPTLFSYLPREDAEAICKLATGDSDADKKTRAMGPVLAGVLGTGVGTMAGVGLGHLGNKAIRALTGKNIPPAVLYGAIPLLGAGAGLAYNLAQAHQVEEMKRAVENSKHRP